MYALVIAVSDVIDRIAWPCSEGWVLTTAGVAVLAVGAIALVIVPGLWILRCGRRYSQYMRCDMGDANG